MHLSKSYKLLNFLNRRHSRATRIILAAMGWLGVLCVTRSKQLANVTLIDFYSDNFKTAFRRCGWYCRTGWPQLDIVKDDFYDFTDSLDPLQLAELEIFLSRRKKQLERHTYLADRLYIQAAKIHRTLENNRAAAKLISDFYAEAKELVDLSNTLLEPPQPLVTKTRIGDFSQQQAKEALSTLSDTLPKDKWKWYVISGTLLGLIREGNFLPHDYDIDLGIHAEDANIEELISTLKNCRKFAIKKIDSHCTVDQDKGEYSIKHTPALIKLIHSNGVNVDIFLHHKEKNIRWHGSIIHRWNNSDFTLKEYSLAGISVLAPSNPELYLEENYGDWKTPVKEFECTTGTPNLTIAKNFLSLALFLKKLVVLKQQDTRSAELHIRALISSGVISKESNNYKLNNYI